ncbi:MAG: hypothetical protein WCB27_08050, partial [Thermoguttaceae bacterium]
ARPSAFPTPSSSSSCDPRWQYYILAQTLLQFLLTAFFQRAAKPVLVELTEKKWKMWQLVGWCVAIPSFLVAAACFLLGLAADRVSPAMVIIGSVAVIVMLLGIGAYAYGAINAWWHHG